MAKNKLVGFADFEERVRKEIVKEYGEGIIITGQDALEEERVVIPWTPSLDTITGGIQEGSWVGISGLEKLGKTTAALAFAVNAQKPEYGSRPVFYSDIERRLATDKIKDIPGLDLKKMRVIRSSSGDEKRGIPPKILSAEDHLQIILNILRTVPRAVVIIDSFSALCPEVSLTDDLGGGGGGVAKEARLVSEFINMAANLVPVNKSIVIGITHLTSKIGMPGYNEKSARRWRYQRDYVVKAKYKQPWKAGGNQVGFVIKWACETSPLTNPGMTIDGYLRFGLGMDGLYELLALGEAAGLIHKSGAWYCPEYLSRGDNRHLLGDGDVPKFQGGEQLYVAFRSNPEWAKALEREVKSMIGMFGGSDEE